MIPYIIEYQIGDEHKTVIVHARNSSEANDRFQELAKVGVVPTMIEAAPGWEELRSGK